MKSVFISYCADNEDTYKALSAELAANGYHVSEDLRLGINNHNTNERIIQSEAKVILLASDNFLKSLECMGDFSEFLHASGDRLIPVIIDGKYTIPGTNEFRQVPTSFQSINDVMHFRDYWYEQWIQLRKQRANISEEHMTIHDEKINLAQKVSNTIGGFLRTLRESKPISLHFLKQDGFAALEGDRVSESAQLEPSETPQPPSLIIEESKGNLEEHPVAEVNESVEPPIITSEDISEDSVIESIAAEMTNEPSYVIETVTTKIESPITEPPLPPRDAMLTTNVKPEEDDDNAYRKPNQAYLDNVSKEMEKAAKIIHEISDEPTLENVVEVKEDKAPKVLPQIEAPAIEKAPEPVMTNPFDDKIYFEQAKSLAADRPKEALEAFKKAIFLNPKNADYHYECAKLLLVNNKAEACYKMLKRAIKIDSSHAASWLLLTDLYLHIFKDQDKAIDAYKKAVGYNPALRKEVYDKLFGLEIPTPVVVEEHRPEPKTQPLATIMVTGATSGIGKATAELLAEKGYDLVITGRRSDRLQTIKAELEEKHGVSICTLCFDVRNGEECKAAIESMPEEFKQIDVLVNNAGLAKGLSTLDEGNIDDWNTMIDTNIKGLLYMTKLVSPSMVARKSGHIINICSTAGKEVYPKGNVYCATKFAVDALNRGMRMDFYPHRIRVTGIFPAHTEDTEFAITRFDGDAERAKIYEDFRPLSAFDVAEAIYFAISRPEYVNISEIHLSGVQQASASFIDRSGR